MAVEKQKDDKRIKMRFSVTEIALSLRPSDDPSQPETTLILDQFQMDVPKAEANPLPGESIDTTYADLVSIAGLIYG